MSQSIPSQPATATDRALPQAAMSTVCLACEAGTLKTAHGGMMHSLWVLKLHPELAAVAAPAQ